MDYLTELASDPDLPEALLGLTTAYQPARWLLSKPNADEQFEGAWFLREEHPNAWIANIIHEFYREPAFAAAAWKELQHCTRFRYKLAARVWSARHAPTFTPFKWRLTREDQRLRSAGDEWAAQETTEADALKAISNGLERDRARLLSLSTDAGLDLEPPRFIKNLLEQEDRERPARWPWRGEAHTDPTTGEPMTRVERAIRLLANPSIVRELAAKLGVPVSFSMVLQGELDQIRSTREFVRDVGDGQRTVSTPRTPTGGQTARVGAPTRQAFREDLLGLAFSGGGIRSATFNLGVLQTLAKIGLLKHCDYLSTVSGGGYIGAWFAAWMQRQSYGRSSAEAVTEMQRRLSPVRNANPLAAAVRPIRHLREYSNYLTPKTGFLSADTWTMVGIYTRNALLNQVILVAMLAALLLVPRNVVQWARIIDGAAWDTWVAPAPVLIVLLCLSACGVLVANLRRLDPVGSENRVVPPDGTPVATSKSGPPWYAQPLAIQLGVVLPWLVAASLTAHHFAGRSTGIPVQPYLIALIVVAGYLALTLLTSAAARCWRGDLTDMVLAFGLVTVVGSSAAAGLVWILTKLFHHLPGGEGFATDWHTVALGGPAILLIFSLTIVVQLGMLGPHFPDEHREWWSRLRSYMHMYAGAWLIWFLVTVYVPWGFHYVTGVKWGRWGGWAGVLAWVSSTIFGVGKGRTAADGKTKNRNDAPPGSPSLAAALMRVALTVAPYIFIAGLIVGVSLAVDAVYVYNVPDELDQFEAFWRHTTWTTQGPQLPVLTAGFLLLSLLFSYRVDINEFSLHHFYKNRLVRCYLGASRSDERKADWFTGFDPDDDLRLVLFDHESSDPKYPGPYPIVNCALNLVGGKDLAWQERKAESFVFTPKFCGYDVDRAVFKPSPEGFGDGYVPTRNFYHRKAGPLLGMATAISGAAANPNMGKGTSAASAFLLTVFNVRLGWWLGNPRMPEAAETAGPPLGLTYTALELTGSTDDEKHFVNVSDGGHFENLAVYELIRRGCRFIIACDAGQDGRFGFEDLGDLVRRCRTDFGVDIDISVERIRDRDSHGWSKVHCVIGKIHYLNVPKRDWRGQLVNEDGQPLRKGDRPAHEVGYLLYLKPSISGDEPYDVLEYYNRSPEFPHESTADQWFGESQFEGYRQLGMHITNTAFARYLEDDTQPTLDVGRLFERLYRFWYPPSAAIGLHSTEHTQTYSRVLELVRKQPELVGLDHALFDGLPSTDDLSGRDEFYVVSGLIQLIEDVYADLVLEENWDHPHVEGWMAVFRRWVDQDAFKRTWAISQSTYAQRFREFYNDRLVKGRRGRRPLTFPRAFIAAHRGVPRPYANTLSAFEAAIAARADAIELDVRVLKDETLVAFHDAADRDGRLLNTLTMKDVGSLVAPGMPAPTFKECLDQLQGRISLDIELKDPHIEALVLKEIRNHAWSTDDFVLTSFDPEMPNRVRRIRGDVRIGLLVDSTNLVVMTERFLTSTDIDFIAPEHDSVQLTSRRLEDFAIAGLPVVPWTVDDPNRLRELFCHAAVAGIITNEVEVARRVRKSTL